MAEKIESNSEDKIPRIKKMVGVFKYNLKMLLDKNFRRYNRLMDKGIVPDKGGLSMEEIFLRKIVKDNINDKTLEKKIIGNRALQKLMYDASHIKAFSKIGIENYPQKILIGFNQKKQCLSYSTTKAEGVSLWFDYNAKDLSASVKKLGIESAQALKLTSRFLDVSEGLVGGEKIKPLYNEVMKNLYRDTKGLSENVPKADHNLINGNLMANSRIMIPTEWLKEELDISKIEGSNVNLNYVGKDGDIIVFQNDIASKNAEFLHMDIGQLKNQITNSNIRVISRLSEEVSLGIKQDGLLNLGVDQLGERKNYSLQEFKDAKPLGASFSEKILTAIKEKDYFLESKAIRLKEGNASLGVTIVPHAKEGIYFRTTEKEKWSLMDQRIVDNFSKGFSSSRNIEDFKTLAKKEGFSVAQDEIKNEIKSKRI